MWSAAREPVPGATDWVNEKTRTSPAWTFPVISAKVVIYYLIEMDFKSSHGFFFYTADDGE